jgi:hypothetical protein
MRADPTGRISTFEEFWPYYLGEHRNPLCRGIHYLGTALVIGTVAAAAVTLNPVLLVATPFVGYGPAWFSHFFVERNRPATFKYPVWSLLADFKMFGLALRGKMGDEMRRYYGSRNPRKDAPRVDIDLSVVEARASA